MHFKPCCVYSCNANHIYLLKAVGKMLGICELVQNKILKDQFQWCLTVCTVFSKVDSNTCTMRTYVVIYGLPDVACVVGSLGFCSTRHNANPLLVLPNSGNHIPDLFVQFWEFTGSAWAIWL